MLVLRVAVLTLSPRFLPPLQFVAADIGTYQTILEILATLSIVTNAVIAIMTCHSLFFYLPWMGPLDRLWGLVLFEHFLLTCKIIISSIVPTEPKNAILTYDVQQERKEQQLAIWDVGFDD